MRRNPFLAFEGIDGSGKSTQANLLSERLRKAGHKVHKTCEPTDGAIGTLIRNILRGKEQMDERAIAALFAADRLDHLMNAKDGLIKQIEEGQIVITDRYYLSSFAYHGAHVPMEWVLDLNRMSRELLKPDTHIYIDIAPEVSLERISRNREGTERYETLGNLTRVRDKYLSAIEAVGDEVMIIDGNRAEHVIADEIWTCVFPMLVQKLS